MARRLGRKGRAARLFALAGALALGTALSGCLGYDGDFDRGYQVDQETVSQIKVGSTTKPQALATLGSPSTTSTVGGDAWYYIGQKMHQNVSPSCRFRPPTSMC